MLSQILFLYNIPLQMAALHQLSVVCTICESPIEFGCKTCGDRLCSKCKVNHLKSRASKTHTIVPYMEGRQHRKQPCVVCAMHGGQQCDFWCQTCDKAICGTCVTSSTHVGHTFGSLGDKIHEKKSLMERQMKTLGISLVAWKKKLEDAKNVKSVYPDEVDALDKRLSFAADKLHVEVKKLLARRRQELQNLRLPDQLFLQRQEGSLAHGIHHMQEEIKHIEEHLKYGDITEILEYSVEENVDCSPPELLTVPLPDFKSGWSNADKLAAIFGRLSAGSSQTQQRPDIPLSVESKKADENNNDQNKGLKKSEVQWVIKHMSIMRTPSVVNRLNAQGISADTLVCYGQNQALVQTEDRDRSHYTTTRALHLTDKYGSVSEVINQEDVFKYEMSVTEQGDIIFTKRDDRCVLLRSKSGDFTTLFHTLWTPYEIFSMQNGNVLLSFGSNLPRVVQYDRTGEVIMEVDRTDDWTDMCKTVRDIRENKANNDIYVCGKWCTKKCSFDYLGKLFAFDSNGKPRYQYPGTPKENTNFCPVCVSSDRMGHVIIADEISVSVHILSEDGRFLQCLMTKEQGLTRITVIDVDEEGHCWIRNSSKEDNDEIVIVQYMK